MDMEASLFDMELDLLGSWDLAQLLAAPDVLVSEQARGLVLPGLSSTAGHWSLVDQSGPSPLDEVPQDSLWLDPTDVISGSPELFSGLQQDDFSPQYRKLPPDFLFDDDSQALPITSDFLLSSSDYISSPTSTLGTSPIDVKFEFGDVHSADQAIDYLTDTSPRVIDNVFTRQTFPTFDHSTTFAPCRPAFILGSYETDQILIDSYETESIPLMVESAVPTSPFTESCSSPLDSLEYYEDDSLHDAENVCQLLMALDGGVRRSVGGLHDTSQILSHVSPEEVESVLSRGSSSGDLVALCDDSKMLSDNSVSRSRNGPSLCTSRLPIAQSSTISGFTGSYTNPAVSLPAVIVSDYLGASLTNKIDSCGATKSRSAPYGEVHVERRVRKKEQNKTAALRYRQKKREEKGHTMTEVEELEQQNQVLKNRADELSKEISYLRGLLEEIKR